MTAYQDRLVRDWSGLSPEDKVVVTEPGRQGYPATIDTKTADSAVVWVIDDGGQRRAFDHREGVELAAFP
ncbi:hypothetical protein OUO20_05635 [Arthrobacter sp. FX8]|uniref:hypothetical protein n=1 Tax=Arthrobacter sp. FX8 TaxID=2997335 RepID=UPI00227D5C98|nr:hypothetical protein [Arthrobacter sp. FX8]WAJ34414.1 hypothetical protein OUO20_05635 [Arthrobacter sp. FX8]